MTDIDDLLRADGGRWRQEHRIEGNAPIRVNTPPLAAAARRRRSMRYRLVLSCGLAVLAVAFVALMLSDDHGEHRPLTSVGGTPTSPASTDALVPAHIAAPVNIAELPPGRRLGPHVHGHLLSMPWELLGVRDGGKSLAIFYASGDDYDIKHIGFRVFETDTSVELIAVSRDTSSGGEEPGNYATNAALISLSRPLGQRALLHAPTDWSADYLSSQ